MMSKLSPTGDDNWYPQCFGFDNRCRLVTMTTREDAKRHGSLHLAHGIKCK